MAFTYDYFGSGPVSVIFSATGNFTGAALPANTVPVITPGVVTFPVITGDGGGLVNFHTRPLTVKVVRMSGPTNLSISIVYPDGKEIEVDALTSSRVATTNSFSLPVGAQLKMVSSGGSGTNEILVVAVESLPYGGL